MRDLGASQRPRCPSSPTTAGRRRRSRSRRAARRSAGPPRAPPRPTSGAASATSTPTSAPSSSAPDSRYLDSEPMDAERRQRLEATTSYDPGEVEARILAGWLEGGHFSPEAAGDPSENYSIAIPPPNVTGALHMGHALNGSIQDALIRLNRMRGRNTLWALGTDHAGIATQAVVEKELRSQGISRHDIGREEFVERVWEWREKYGSTIVEQLKRLGASCDYERERFTLDEGYVRAVYRVFKALYEKGYVYRDNYIVNWDVGSRSVISELEVFNQEVADRL